jgi:group I intron endonuclease
MYIYKITNIINHKVYIGQTVQKNPKMRWYDHCAKTRHGKNNHLYNSMRLYGIDNFVWEVIDSADTIETLNDKEEYWLSKYRTITEVYNIREAGGNKTHSAKSIEKMKAAQKLRHSTTNVGGWKRRDGGAMLGKSHPKKGKPSKKWNEEMKAAHSIRCKEREARKKLAHQEN